MIYFQSILIIAAVYLLVTGYRKNLRNRLLAGAICLWLSAFVEIDFQNAFQKAYEYSTENSPYKD